MRLARSLAFRLSLQYASIIILSVSTILGLHYLANVMLPTRAIKADLRSELADLAQIYGTEGIAELTKVLDVRRHTQAERLPFHALTDAEGKVVTSNLPSWPLRGASDWLRIEADLHLEGREEDREALVLDHHLEDGTRLLIGRNIEDLDDLEEEIQGAGAVLLLLAAALSLAGILMGRSVGQRIEALDTAARQIMGSSPSRRIPLAGKNDDLDRLAQTLNQMLTRLEAAIAGLRRTSDRVAHELRTPLARLQSLLEGALREQSASKASLALALEEVENLGRLFDSVLAIARLESEHARLEMRSVDLSEILAHAAELYGGISDERNLRFRSDIQPDLHMHGNADVLFQAACNLLDNAMKFTPAGGAVSLLARGRDCDIVVEVSDSGPGIPEDMHELVTRPFYRAPSVASIPGNGLGLAFVAAVNGVHGATMNFRSNGTGLRVEWRIPRN